VVVEKSGGTTRPSGTILGNYQGERSTAAMPGQSIDPVVRHVRKLAGGAPSTEASDHELLCCFAADHDEAAFSVLLSRHGPMVRDVCRRLLGQKSDVDDAFQAVFLILARQAQSVRNRQSLAGWLHGVAYRTAQRARRDAARRRRREACAPARPPADPVREAAWRELCAALDAELCRLPEAQRGALVLCYLEGCTRDEAARQLHLPVRTLDRRLERGKALLRIRLARQGVTLSGAALALGLAQSPSEAGVQAALLTTTLKAAALLAAGNTTATAAIRAEVVALMEGVLQAMLRTKLKLVTVALLTLGLLVTATGLFAFRAMAYGPRSDSPLAVSTSSPAGEPAPGKEVAGPDVYALLLIEEREPRVLLERSAPNTGSDAATFRRTQIVLLKSRLVLQAALRKEEVKDLEILKQQKNSLAWLEKSLSAVFLDDSNVLRISIREGSAQERAALANAVAYAYMEETADREAKIKRERLKQLDEVRSQQENILRDKRQVLQALAVKTGQQARSMKHQFDSEDLAQFRAELHRVRVAKIRAQARLNYLQRAASGDEAKAARTKLEEEIAVLAEQEKLLRGEIGPLAEAAESLARRETAEAVDLTAWREQVQATEQIAQRIAGEVETLRVELAAEPRIRLLQKAEAPRPNK
jgi:RNA polymerase sigma factor (sigma-70 family)